MEIAVIGDEDTITGFRLAGVKKIYDEDKAEEILHELFRDEHIGILIMTEKFANKNRVHIARHRSLKQMFPIIVEVPDISGPMEGRRDAMKELIKKAIGTDITEK